MPTYIVLLRGIGGGIRTLPMKKAVAALEGSGLANVQSYIATGNFVLTSRKQAPQLAKHIEACIEKNFGFFSKTFVLSVAELEHAAKGNPFPQAEADPKSLHLFFLAAPTSKAKLDAINKAKAAHEEIVLRKRVLYFYAPAGFGTSKVAGRIERLLGVDTTARNWRTVTKVLELARARND
jgi:uncharacterized protein (DUF1697 family)